VRALIPLLLSMLGACRALSSPEVTERVATAPDGVKIAYDERGSGGPTLIFVHCWAGERSFWREQLDEFAGAHRVIALDLAGHGRSGMHADVSLEKLGRDVVAVADDARVDSCILIGHSLGGPVSLAAASAMPGRVLAVVGVETLQDVELDVPHDEVERYLAAFAADYKGTMRSACRALLPRKTPNALVKWITERACAADPGNMLAIARSLVGTDMATLLESARVPVRCINSAANPPTISATSIEHNRKHGDFDAVLIEGTGHYPQLERSREFNLRLEQLLDALEAARPQARR